MKATVCFSYRFIIYSSVSQPTSRNPNLGGYAILSAIPVAAQSETWVCDRSIARNVGSNPA